MFRIGSVSSLAGPTLFAALASLSLAPLTYGETITVDDLRVWESVNINNPSGIPSEGTLGYAPGHTAPSNGNNAPPVDFQLRLSDLDLDGVGGTNDYVDFTLTFSAARDTNPQVNVTGAGIGVTGDLSPGDNEALTVSVSSVSLSPGTLGSIGFDGFTATALYLGGNGIVTSGQADVNGNTITDGFDATGGFTFNITEQPLAGLPSSVLIDNVQASDGDFRWRTSDLQFNYTPVEVPEPSTLVLFGVAGVASFGLLRRR